MTRTSIAALTAAAVLTGMLPASATAEPLHVDREDAIERRLLQEAERRRTRELGGYSDPITFLSKLFRGEDVSNDIQPVINDYKEFQTFPKKPAKK